jgi:hypothetical protein
VSGNNRVYFACLGVAKCGGGLLSKVISAELGLNRKVNTIFSPGSSSAVATYSDMPDTTFSYTSYLDTITPIANEDGVNNFIGFDMAIGLDNGSAGLFSGSSSLIPNANGSPPYAAIRCSMANLVSLKYSLPVDGFFTVTREYRGYSKSSTNPPGSFTESQGDVLRRQCFTGTLPANIANNAIQNIDITYSINRTPVGEFSTRKPYASYVNFPLETTISFDMITQTLDSYSFDALQSACKTQTPSAENITISIENAGAITITSAYLTDLRYNGGSANSNDSQTLTATYTSYTTFDGISPVIFSGEVDSCG